MLSPATRGYTVDVKTGDLGVPQNLKETLEAGRQIERVEPAETGFLSLMEKTLSFLPFPGVENAVKNRPVGSSLFLCPSQLTAQ